MITLEEARQKYLNLCDKAGEQKIQWKYSYHVGICHGFMEGISDFFGAEESVKLMEYAASLNKTVMGIPPFNQKKEKQHA